MKCAFCCVFFLTRPRLQQSVAAPPPRQWADGALRLVETVEGRAVAPGRQSGSRSLRVHTCDETALLSQGCSYLVRHIVVIVTFSSVIQSWTTRPSALWRLCLCPGDERASSPIHLSSSRVGRIYQNSGQKQRSRPGLSDGDGPPRQRSGRRRGESSLVYIY